MLCPIVRQGVITATAAATEDVPRTIVRNVIPAESVEVEPEQESSAIGPALVWRLRNDVLKVVAATVGLFTLARLSVSARTASRPCRN